MVTCDGTLAFSFAERLGRLLGSAAVPAPALRFCLPAAGVGEAGVVPLPTMEPAAVRAMGALPAGINGGGSGGGIP